MSEYSRHCLTKGRERKGKGRKGIGWLCKIDLRESNGVLALLVQVGLPAVEC